MKHLIKPYKLKDGKTYYRFRYFAGFDEQHHQKYITRSTFKTKKAAEIELAKIIREIEEKGLPSQKAYTFEELYLEWRENEYKNSVRAITVSRTDDLFRLHILPILGKMKVQKITPKHCLTAVNKWREYYVHFKVLKSHTQNVLDYAQLINVIRDNPMRAIKMPKAPAELEYREVRQENFYSRNELHHFLCTAKEQLSTGAYTLFHTLAYTGLRKGELLALNWFDIDYQKQTVSITKSYTTINGVLTITKPKNQTSYRTLVLDHDTMHLLNTWQKEQEELYHSINLTPPPMKERPVFTYLNYYNEIVRCYPDYPNNILKTFYKKNPTMKKISPHGFRHTHTTLLFESGAGMKEVQERLGHSTKDIHTTFSVYTHVSNERRIEAIEKLSHYLDTL